jgi:hypothetical protein
MLTVSTSVSSLRWLLWHLPSQHWPGPQPRWAVEQIIFMNIQGILLEPRVPARMLSGLYRLLATMPGATLKGDVTDTLGRRALEVDYRYPLSPRERGTDMKLALLFDPESYALLDVTQTTTSTKFPDSYSETSYVNSGLVHHIGALPSGFTGDRVNG